MDERDKRLTAWVRRELTERSMTLLELTEGADIGYASANRWMNGKGKLSRASIEKIADFLGLAPDTLYEVSEGVLKERAIKRNIVMRQLDRLSEKMFNNLALQIRAVYEQERRSQQLLEPAPAETELPSRP